MTVVYDSFDRANNASVGTADSGQAWNVIEGSVGINANRAKSPLTGNQYATAVIDHGGSDGTITLFLVNATVQTEQGVAFRVQDANNGWYAFMYRPGVGTDAIYIVKNNAGSRTIETSAAASSADGTMTVTLEGDAIEVELNGTTISVSDSFLASETNHGLHFFNDSVVDDYNFSPPRSAWQVGSVGFEGGYGGYGP